ncbi:MAG: AsmA family protein [Bacteroidetes bacterium]|nr:AsmA family protein [Bacteroidota bacterium]
MKRILIRVSLGIFLSIVTLVLTLALAGYAFQDKVKALIIQKINEQVTVPISVRGGVDFSLLQHFPYASVTFHDVSVKNKLKGGRENLLQVREFSFLFNMWGLLSHKIEVSQVYASDGALNMYLDALGNANWDIFKKSADNKPSAGLNLDLQHATIHNVKYTYLTGDGQEDIQLNISKLGLSGNFRAARFDLDAKGTLMIDRLQINGDEYIAHKAFDADITIDVDQQQKRFALNKGNIEIEKNKFVVNGFFVTSKRNTYVQFAANSQGKDISKLIALIPLRFTAQLAGTEGSGGYTVATKIYGHIRPGINPIIEVTAALHDAEIQIPKISKPLQHVTAQGYYRMDSVGDDRLTVSKFHSEFNGYPQQFELKLVHLRSPDIDFSADGTADLHELRTFFSDTILQSATGLVTFRQFHIQGNKRDFDNAQNANIRASGEFDLKDVNVQADNVAYENINGHLSYHDNDISIHGLSAKFLNTEFVFDGTVNNLIAYSISQDRRINTADIPLGVDGTLKMHSFDLSSILHTYDNKGKPHHSTGKAKLDIRDVFNMDGHLQVSVDKFVYEHMLFEDVKADLGLVPYRIDIRSLSATAMGGQITDVGYVAFLPSRQMLMNLGLNIDKVDLPMLFRECDNFHQTTLTDKNLKGRVSATLALKTVWNNYKDIDLDKLSGSLSCSVLHGELNDFDPIKSASAFIKVDELNHIVFSDLNNTLSIQDRVITIPRMEIQSSALNLIMSGTHTLDNQIDYHLKINLHKLLAAKFGSRQSDVQYIEEDPYAGVNLYLLLTGDISNPKIRYDREQVKKKLKQDLADQKEELKGLFKKEKTQKPANKEAARREEKYYDTRKKPEFIDFDEEKEK